jgi:flagellar hook-length control protein FliK
MRSCGSTSVIALRASATSRISPAALTPHPAAHAATKADDAGQFALMLATAPQSGATHKDPDKSQNDDTSDHAPPADAGSHGQSPVTASFQKSMQAAAPAAKKDAKTDTTADKDTATAAAPSGDAQSPVDPATLPAITLAVPPPIVAPMQNTPDAAAADANDAPTAGPNVDPAQAAAPPGLATPIAPQSPSKPAHAQDDTGEDQAAPAAQDPAQPIVQQLAAAAPDNKANAIKPALKPGKDESAKAATPNAGDAVKPGKPETTENTATFADIQAAKADAKPDNQTGATAAPPAQGDAPASLVPNADTTLNGIAAPQPAQNTIPAAATQTAVNLQVAAQPHANFPALAADITAKSQSGARQFDIRLDPPELGHVEVRLSIDATGKASAHLSADQPQTLDLLQKDSSSLTRALRDAGLDVSQNGLNFSLRQQGGNGQGQNAFTGGNARTTRLSAGIDTTSTSNATSAYRAPLDGRLDIRV